MRIWRGAAQKGGTAIKDGYAGGGVTTQYKGQGLCDQRTGSSSRRGHSKGCRIGSCKTVKCYMAARQQNLHVLDDQNLSEDDQKLKPVVLLTNNSIELKICTQKVFFNISTSASENISI